MTRPIPWLRIVAEGIAIVVSILLAFGIQAWWEGRGDEEQRQALIVGLASDFEAADEGLGRTLGRWESMREATGRLIDLTGTTDASADLAPGVDSLLSMLFASPTFDPPMGSVQAVINSGALQILENAELVRELTAWPSMVEDLKASDYRVSPGALQQFLMTNGINLMDLSWTSTTLPWEARRTDAYRFLSDPEFKSLLGLFWAGTNGRMRLAMDIGERISRIRMLLAEAGD